MKRRAAETGEAGDPAEGRRPPDGWLAVALTLVSAASMALEIIAGRALAPYVGMSLYTWTVIIAVVLAGLSLGHWFGGLVCDRGRALHIWVAGSLTGAAITSAGCLLALHWIEPWAAAHAPVAHVAALSAGAFLLPSVLAGILSPILTKMALDAAPHHQGRILGRMFALGAFGAILGTLVAGLVMVSWIGTAGSVMVIALLYGGLSLIFWNGRARFAAATALLMVGGTGALTPASPCLKESAYFCIRVDDLTYLGRPARVMALDHLVHGVNDAGDPTLLLTPYVHGVDEIVRLRAPGPIDAFYIGGGAYSLPRAWASRYPDSRQVIAELDPQVTQVARDHLWLGSPPNIEVIHDDARAALAGLPPGPVFDVILGDAFHDVSVPQHLVTDEFHALLKARLKSGGIYAMNVVDKLREPRFVLSLARTLGARFAHVELWLDIEAVSPFERRTTWIVIASDTATRVGEVTARDGFGRTWVRVPTDAMIRAVGADTLVFLTDDFSPVDRLMRDLLLSGTLLE